MSRGLRNNNPFNIRISNSQWKGKVVPSQDKDFETFKTITLGVRAGLKLIINHITGGSNTISKLVSKWAPATENATTSYIDYVSKKTGIAKSQIISPLDKETVIRIAEEMTAFETGHYLDKSYYDEAWRLL